jgi:carboxylesterase type B
MELQSVLNQLKGISKSGMTKTAAEAPPVKEAESKNELMAALDGALRKSDTTKTAAVAPRAAAELVKVATDLAAAEQEALTKQAHLYGAALADGFVARLNQHTTAAGDVKTASSPAVPTKQEFDKFASENPELVKNAMELGYRDAETEITRVKMAQAAEQDAIASFNQGYQDAVAQAKTASAPLHPALQKLASTPEGQEKLAAFKKGYEETIAEAVKLAEDCYGRGYNDTIQVLRAL